MNNVLSANLRRLWKGKGFLITVLLMLCLESLFCLELLNQNSTRIDLALYISIQGIGIFISVAFSLFYGTEYSDNTLRNKLIVGHKRRDIYLAGWLSTAAAVSVLYMLWIGTGAVFAIIMHLPIKLSSHMLFTGIIGWLACISYISIYNLIGMLSSNKAKTSIMTILCAFALLFGGLACYSLARPGLLSETNRLIFQLLFDFNPYGQIFQFMTLDKAGLWRLGMYSVFLTVCLNATGIYLFERKDIK